MPNYYLIVLSIVTDRVSEIGFSSIENYPKNGLKMLVQLLRFFHLLPKILEQLGIFKSFAVYTQQFPL